MPIPVIDTRTSEQAWLTGRPQAWQPSATESPTSWSATGLPSGVSINGSTGLISGTPTTRGVFMTSIVATNGSGDSAPLLVPFSVRGAAGLSQDSEDQLSLLIDFDLTTGEISIPGVDSPEPIDVEDLAAETATTRIKRELMRVKSGEIFPVLVGFRRDGVLQDIDVNKIELSARENEPEEAYEITEDSSSITKVGSGEDTRFRTTLSIPEALLESVFSNFEDDNGTQAGLLAEISAAIVVNVFDWETETDASAASNLGPGDVDIYDHRFYPLPEATTGKATYTALCEVLWGDSRQANQELALSLDFSVEWNGSEFEVSDIPSVTSITGTEDDAGSHFLTTLDADIKSWSSGALDGVEVTLTTTNSLLGDGWVVEMRPPGGVVNSEIGDTGDGSSAGGGLDLQCHIEEWGTTTDSADIPVYVGDTATTIKDAFNAAHNAAGFSPTDPVESVIMDNYRDRVLLIIPSGTIWQNVYDGVADRFPAPYNDLDSYAQKYTQVTLSGDPDDEQIIRSSDTFVLTAERSINRD